MSALFYFINRVKRHKKVIGIFLSSVQQAGQKNGGVMTNPLLAQRCLYTQTRCLPFVVCPDKPVACPRPRQRPHQKYFGIAGYTRFVLARSPPYDSIKQMLYSRTVFIKARRKNKG